MGALGSRWSLGARVMPQLQYAHVLAVRPHPPAKVGGPTSPSPLGPAVGSSMTQRRGNQPHGMLRNTSTRSACSSP